MSGGRKSKYNAQFHIPWVRGLAMRGLTVAEIAKELGVAKSTLCLWVKKDAKLSDALNEGREYTDVKVEQSLLSRAMGVTVTERKTILRASGEGAGTPDRIEVLEKSYPPDTVACIFWLKNRRPDIWRDKRDVIMDGGVDVRKAELELGELLNEVE